MKTPVTTKISRYTLYLIGTSTVYFISMLMMTALFFHSPLFMLGIPISLLIVLGVRTKIGNRIYGDKISVHRVNTNVHIFLRSMSIVLIVLSFRFMGSSRSGYVDASPLLLAAGNTGYFVIASLLLQFFRGMFYSPYDEDEDDELEEENVVEQ